MYASITTFSSEIKRRCLNSQRIGDKILAAWLSSMGYSESWLYKESEPCGENCYLRGKQGSEHDLGLA